MIDTVPNKQPQARPATTRIDRVLHSFKADKAIFKTCEPTPKFIPDPFWATSPGCGAPNTNQRKRRLARRRSNAVHR